MKTFNVEITVQRVVIVNTGENEWNKNIEDRVSGLTKKAYGWSKWGGKNLGLVQEKKTNEWSCQTCGERQGSELPSYMFEFSENEFIRICSICQAKKLLNHIKTLQELVSLVRQHREAWDT